MVGRSALESGSDQSVESGAVKIDSRSLAAAQQQRHRQDTCSIMPCDGEYSTSHDMAALTAASGEPEPEPEALDQKSGPHQQGAAERAGNAAGRPAEPPLFDSVMVASAVPTIDSSAPRRGESCVVLHRAQMRARAAIDSEEAGVLGEGEDVTVLDVRQLPSSRPEGDGDGQTDTGTNAKQALRVLCEVRRGSLLLRGWVSHVAQTGEVLLDAGFGRRRRYNLVVDYCATYGGHDDGCKPLGAEHGQVPGSGPPRLLRRVDPPGNALDFAFPVPEQPGRLSSAWDGRFVNVRTLETGERQYGFCSRLRRADGRIEVCVITTRHAWFELWNSLLDRLDATRRAEDDAVMAAQQRAAEGDAVEVFSARTQSWLEGEITAVDWQASTDGPIVSVRYEAAARGDRGGDTSLPAQQEQRKTKARTKCVALTDSTVVRLQHTRLDTPAAMQQLAEALIKATGTAGPAAQQRRRLPEPCKALVLDCGERRVLGRPDLGGPLTLQPRPPVGGTAAKGGGGGEHAHGQAHHALLTALPVAAVMAIFAALVLEQRLIFVSAKIPLLSACVHSAVALLLPFEWQHIFVPLLPRIWLDYLTAPMPFVMGLHSSLMPEAERIIYGGGAEDQLVLVMLDEGAVRLEGFEASPTQLLPPTARRRLERRLTSLQQELQQQKLVTLGGAGGAVGGGWMLGGQAGGAGGVGGAELARRFAKDVQLAFASFMASVFGHYRQYLRALPQQTEASDDLDQDQGGKSRDSQTRAAAAVQHRAAEFDVEGFVSLSGTQRPLLPSGGGDEAAASAQVGAEEGSETAHVRQFLRACRDSQMFERFCMQREQMGLRWPASAAGGAADIFTTLVRQQQLRQVRGQKRARSRHAAGGSSGSGGDGAGAERRGGGGDNDASMENQDVPGSTGAALQRQIDQGLKDESDRDRARNVLGESVDSQPTHQKSLPPPPQQRQQLVDSPSSAADDQLSAAELRAKNAGAVDLWLASGMVSFYQVEQRAWIRTECARHSQQVGVLEVGEIIKVSEVRGTRVRFDRGWTSIKSGDGVRLLKKIEV
jgi:hypothetical protein